MTSEPSSRPANPRPATIPKTCTTSRRRRPQDGRDRGHGQEPGREHREADQDHPAAAAGDPVGGREATRLRHEHHGERDVRQAVHEGAGHDEQRQVRLLGEGGEAPRQAVGDGIGEGDRRGQDGPGEGPAVVTCERHGGPPVAFVPGSRARGSDGRNQPYAAASAAATAPAAAGTTRESSLRTTRRRLASSYAGSVTRPDVVDLALVAGCLGLAAWSTVAGGETLFTGVFIAFVYSCLAVLGRAGVAGALRVRREATRARELARTDPRELARAAISEERGGSRSTSARPCDGPWSRSPRRRGPSTPPTRSPA